ncbi:MAG: ABC transporter substrate-binding protein [Bacillus sp. (in: firmicutes)]
MKKRSLLLFLVLMMVISAALIGCSSDDKANGDDKDTGGSKGASTEEATDGTLIFGRGGDSTSLDPAMTTEGEAFKVTENVLETLISFGKDNMDLEPGLATEWASSEDGLTYTLTLREGVKFHDGTDFNADAVVFNFERWKAGDKEQFYYYNSQFGDLIKEVKVVDAKTVEITTTRPLAPFFKNLAMAPFAISSPAAIEKYGDKYSDNPVGTGPFVFKEWKRNDIITIEKNTDYWQEGLPKLDSIIFRVIPENSARVNALMAGEVDLIDGVNYSDAPSIESNGELQIIKRPSLNVAYLGLTATRGPLKEKLVRQALNHAVNKETLIEAFYSGSAEPAINPMPPVVEGYNPDVVDYEYDLEKAKALLAEAGYADGFEMELWAMPVARPYMPDGQKIAEALQADFEKIGVKTKIVTYEWATYLDKARLGEADSFLLGWTGDNGDADNFLYVLLDQDSIGSNNYTYYENQDVHDLLIAAQSTVNQEERNKLYEEAQVLIKEDAPWIPLVHSQPLLAAGKSVTDFVPHPKGSDDLKEVYLSK